MPPSASRGPRETQVYPSVSSTVFQGIACVQLDEDEWWLVADMQTACTPEGQSPMLAECLVASLLIPIGMPIMVALQLYSQRRELQTPGTLNTKNMGGRGVPSSRTSILSRTA